MSISADNVNKPAVETLDLNAGYRGAQIIRGVNLTVPKSQVVGLVGPNGAGKSTLLRALFGKASIVSGKIMLFGEDFTSSLTIDRVKARIAYVEQGAKVFGQLSVRECLRVAWLSASGRQKVDFVDGLDGVLDEFSALGPRLAQQASSLSGGERQMLAIGMALIQRPRLLLLDEPSIGLAPKIVSGVMRSVANIRDRRGVTVLLAEQDVRAILPVVSSLYVLKAGIVQLQLKPDDVRSDDDIRRLLL